MKKEREKYNLFLDDIRLPEECFSYTQQSIYIENDWVIVRSYDEFVKIIEEKGIPHMISFDHDRADEHYGVQDRIDQDDYDMYQEKTGFHCAKWLIYHCIDNELQLPKFVLIHSMNPVGSKNISSLFKTYEKIYKNGK